MNYSWPPPPPPPSSLRGGFGLPCLWAAGVFVSYDEPICVKSSLARHPAELQVRWFSGTGPSLPEGQQAWAAEERRPPLPPTHPRTPLPPRGPVHWRTVNLNIWQVLYLSVTHSREQGMPCAHTRTHRHTHTQWPSWDAMGYHHLTLQRLSPAVHVLHRSCPTGVLVLAERRWGCVHTCWVV